MHRRRVNHLDSIIEFVFLFFFIMMRMACDRQMLISAVLIVVNVLPITFSELLQRNVTSASVIFDDWKARELPLPKIHAKGHLHSLDILKTYNNCAGFHVIFIELNQLS